MFNQNTVKKEYSMKRIRIQQIFSVALMLHAMLTPLFTQTASQETILPTLTSAAKDYAAQQSSRGSMSYILPALATAAAVGGIYYWYTRPTEQQAPITVAPSEQEPLPVTPQERKMQPQQEQAQAEQQAVTKGVEEKNNALLFAVKKNKFDEVKQLLEEGADPNAMSSNKISALMYSALMARDDKIVKLLIDHGANVNAQDDNGKTALMYATENTLAALFNENASEPDPIVRTLIARGADIDLRDNQGNSVIEYVPEKSAHVATARRKRYLRQERVNQMMRKGLPVEELSE
jgi:hypothetical protein